jgi:hypothetical protein
LIFLESLLAFKMIRAILRRMVGIILTTAKGCAPATVAKAEPRND